jgi:transposase
MSKPTSKRDARQRKPRSPLEWGAEVARWKRSGMTATEYAARHGISRSSLFAWSKHVCGRRDTPASSFVPLRVAAAKAPIATPFSLEITLRNGRTLRTHGDVDAARLACVVDALDGGSR